LAGRGRSTAAELFAGVLLLAGTCLGLPTLSQAQSKETTCSGRARVDFVYAVMLRRGAYEYRAYVRNLTGDTLGWTLSLGSFPSGTSPPLEHPMRGFLAPYAGETLRIGRGTSDAINLETVEVLYDRAGGAAPFLSLRDCIARPG
jgi:hypothetical protein